MLRKNIAPVMATVLSGMLFIIIGSCFSAFLYRKEIIKVENPKVVFSSDIVVYDEGGEKTIEEINLSKMKLGLKPATGDEDSETNIPTTISDKQGSEGHYGKVMVYAPSGVKIVVTDIIIESEESKEKIKEERKNLMLAVKEIDESATNLYEDRIEVGSLTPNQDKKVLTFYVWLSAKATDILEASTISFKVNFEPLI